MVTVQKKSQRKASGARYKSAWSKRLHQKGGRAAHTTIDARRTTITRTRGGSKRNALLRCDTVNVYDSAAKKHLSAKIQSVAENPANHHFIRRNIITKGAVVVTDLGNVRITNRPGQEGTLNGVKVE